MKNTFLTKTLAVLLFVFALSFTLTAQTINEDVCKDWKNMEYSMFSAEYHIYYGCESYAAQNYQAAAREFESGAKKFSDNAALFYHLGSAYAAYASMNKDAAVRESLVDKAREAFEKALKLDASLKSRVNAVLSQEPEETGSNASVDGEPEIRVPRIGDEIEIEAIPDKWVRGKVTRIVGGLPCPVLEVEHDAYGDGNLRKLNFFCKSFRPLTRSTKLNKTTAKKIGTELTLGTYGCSEKSIGRGSFVLQANGKYTQTRGGGSYKYNAAAKEITFTGGWFGNTEAIGKVISSEQIDIQYAAGNWWTCALEK